MTEFTIPLGCLPLTPLLDAINDFFTPIQCYNEGDVLLLNTQLFTEMESTRIDMLVVEEEGVCDVNVGNGECQQGNEQHLEGSEKLEEPKVGMVFSSQDDVYRYYTNYGIQQGFRVNRRSTRCDDYGILRYFTFACSREKKRVSTSKNRYSNLTSGTNCQAKIRTIMQCDGSFKLSGVVLEHNHPLTPGETRCFKYKKLDQDAKTRVRQQSRTSDIVQTGICETLMVGDKRSRNNYGQVKTLMPEEGDAAVLQNFFVKMQTRSSNFFYVMDMDEDCTVRNIFWADARSRAAYEDFGDVVTLDTSNLGNKFVMPLVPFVGVNHHGQAILLGCALLSNEAVGTFLWLFKSWLACMMGIPPKAIITDQSQAIQKAVQTVFPNVQYRWCLWQVMKKTREKLKGCSQYEAIKISLQNSVCESTSKDEFEDEWRKVIEKYGLHDNEWLKELYVERHRWVPIYTKETFWAGMSTARRSESSCALFNGHVNSKTTLKQFLEQYDNLIRSKVEKESRADYESLYSRYDCITHYEIEKQFQEVYTNKKFKEFQEEIMGKLYCYTSLVKEGDSIFVIQVTEHVKVGDSEKDAKFIVNFNAVDCELNCTCHLFEFSGIICRHTLSVLTQSKVQQVPSKYILSRWRKDIKRKCSFVKANYKDLDVNPTAQRYDEMCKYFHEVATMSADCKDQSITVMNALHELKAKIGMPV
ncbi:hypothetical protein MKW98_014083 [Papaver atlanticum]|uniref:Protein FAR1-RELATED SEQUENCE n=1 Tax=Papaver atlanticum TaxID=357466 RepID=A0AAD4SKE7_9MAGN|nr:hypothetical protein MKW98_014083 [Papaver atlanticum]